MKRTDIMSLIVVVTVGFLGCQSKVAFTDYKGGGGVAVSGKYSVKAVGMRAELVLAGLKSSDSELFSEDSGAIAEPVTLKITCESKNDVGGLVAFNNLIALCTLTIWPYVNKDVDIYDIAIKTPYGEKTSRISISERMWTSLSPICLIPYPSSGEWRGTNGELFCDYENVKLAEAVKSILSTAEYDRYCKEETQRRIEAQRIRDTELKRIGTVKKSIEGMLASKCWKEAVAVCEAELKEKHQGAQPEDASIWTDLKKKAEAAIAEERRLAEEAAKAAEEAKRAAIEAAENQEIADAVVNDRNRRLQSAKSKLVRAENMKQGTEKDVLIKKLSVEIKVLERLLEENPLIDYGDIK